MAEFRVNRGCVRPLSPNYWARELTVRRRPAYRIIPTELEGCLPQEILNHGRAGVAGLTKTSSQLIKEGGGLPHLLLFTVTGLVDAVLTLDDIELLVACLFSAPDVAKYWSQQINSHATFVSHIPPSMLLGPASATD
ncbi:hypothetical protein BO82DRAFT_362391 [Aspergillus uvarum CBS 121591]|uniref:Uncharacterized protein n=1 Tax=Aspergillus uvarum CBS 121591 TaxID=1448315 RepID=A0A319D9I4_9EURO|nr:hypothetical protein BO82DRAFT_362391 [Aspergillus uvarum CBS 121591]PYH84648.1 hypothetical protein BO82DRAFT_362391 [Aspergillus uvarum CBS 121591]